MSPKHYPLSYSQQSLLFLYRSAPTSGVLNICLSFKITSYVNADALRKVWQRLVNRHDLLRTTFPTLDGAPVCLVHPPSDGVNFEEIDTSKFDPVQLQRAVSEQFLCPFVLEEDPAYRIRLFRQAREEAVFLLTTHHIVCDGLSLLNLINEMMLLYANETGFHPEAKPLPTLKKNYADFVDHQRELLAGPRGEHLYKYWEGELSGELPMLDLPVDKPRPLKQTMRGGSHTINLDKTLAEQLRTFCKQEGAPPGNVFLAVYKILLMRYTRQRDISVGVPALGRKKTGFLRVVGDFTNTVVVRSRSAGNPSFREFLGQVRGKVEGAMAHQEYPFALVVEKFCARREPARAPIIQTMFVLQSLNHSEKIQSLLVPESEDACCVWNNLTLQPFNLMQQEGEHEFALEMWEGKEDFFCIFKYNTDLFERATIERLAAHFRTLLVSLIEAPGLGIHSQEFMSGGERSRLVALNTSGEFIERDDATVMNSFEKQTRLMPNNVALVVNERKFSYGELDEQSERLAHHLRENCGVRRGDIVALLLKRSEKMLVGILAVLKAGAAYLPIDLSSPAERINYLLEDSATKLLLVDQPECDKVPPEMAQINVQDERLYVHPVPRRASPASAQDVAYIIYTSGTTGYPKGCQVTHKNIVALFENSARLFEFGSDDVWVMAHSYTFDFSVWEMYGALFHGGTLVLPEQHEIQDVAQFRALLCARRVTILNQTPGAFYNFIDEELRNNGEDEVALSLRCVIFGGDKLEVSKLAGWANRHPPARVKLVNMYGITETTVHVTYHHITVEDIRSAGSPIGRPLPGVELYVLDEELQLVPQGVTGELFVGGSGVSRGYLNRPGLTAERFVPHPFHPHTTIYKSGDLGRWARNNTLEYMGRNDEQVKVRGFRIELGEIENILLGHPSVREAVVVARIDSQGNQYLSAYATPKEAGWEPEAADSADLRGYLKSKLPGYMVPSFLVWIERLPLTSNNKIDKRSLPNPEQLNNTGDDFVAPRTPLEHSLVTLWEGVLCRERISLTDDFFEIGGHSLKATHLIAQMHRELGVKVELLELFTHRDIASLARVIEDKQGEVYEAIKPLDAQPYYELSRAQKRMWVLSQLSESSVAYNISVAYKLKGTFNVEAFAWALKSVVARHESLRTIFVESDGALMQMIRDAGDDEFSLEVVDHDTGGAIDEAIHAIIEEDANTPFDLSKGPLVRAKLIKLSAQETLLLFTMHHIISDGWSMRILIKDVWSFYDERCRAENAAGLKPLLVQYKEFAAWQNQLLDQGAYDAHREYWLNELSGTLPVLDLLTDYPRPKTKTFHGNRVEFSFDASSTAALNRFCTAEGYTLFQILFAGVNVLLHRYTGQTDLTIGVPVGGRIHADLAEQIGLYVNTLAVRSGVEAQDTLADVLRRVKHNTLRAFEHQAYPFDQLVEDLAPVHDLSRSVLFDVMVVLQNTGVEVEQGFRDRGIELTPLKAAQMVSRFDLMFEFTEQSEHLKLSIEYNTDLFARARIERITSHLENILRSMVDDTERRVGDVAILSDAERNQVTLEFNQTDVAFPATGTMQDLFEKWARETPEAIAVKTDCGVFSYRELNERANRLARYLRDKFDLARGNLVGLMLERSERMIIGVQAILKSGAAYVPIDPAYPPDRIRYMLEDASVKALLVDNRVQGENFGVAASTCVSFEEDHPFIDAYSAQNPHNVNHPADLAYVIYTSGSTGRPKGVMVEHRNAVNMSYDQKLRFAMTGEDTVLQFASISFDQSVFEMCMALHKGATLVLLPRETLTDALAFEHYLVAHQITIALLPPAFLSTLDFDRLRGLRLLLTGGEVVNAAHLLYCSEFTDCHNVYGPTECSVYTSTYRVTEADRGRDNIPIGKPTSNTRFYILDDRMNLQPVGVPGELYIGGASVGRGYFNRPDLTAERFVPDLFNNHGKLYKTGDLARWLPDGNVEYLGRQDEQVKIRGFRIELGEIEHALFAHIKIREAAVMVREDAQGHRYLVAYYAAAEPLSAATVKAHLQARLPDYMVPAFTVQLDALPLTPSAKVDKRALPGVEGFEVGDTYRAPRTELERRLVNIWETLLEPRPIGISDNFFDLGGHSLRATQLVSRIQKELEVKVTLPEVFLQPTIEALAGQITELRRSTEPTIELVGAQEFYPLSYAQHSIWMLSQTEDASVAYNMPGAFTVDGELDVQAFEAAFSSVVARHESLRTTFVVHEGEPWQRIRQVEEYAFALNFNDLSETPETLTRVNSLLEAEASTAFDLANGPLVRARLLRLSSTKFILLFTAHHIISDGWSMNILVNEVITLYLAYRQGLESPLPPLRLNYKDYVAWHARQLSGEAMRAQRDFWVDQFADGVAALQLPIDFPRPSSKSYIGGRLSSKLEESSGTDFANFCRRQQVSPFMLMLASLCTLLYHQTGQTDIVIGTPIAGRNHIEFEDQIGLYINTLALRTRFKAEESFVQLLARVRQNLLKAYENQLFPLELLVEELNLPRVSNRSPLFDVMVVYQNQGNALLDLSALDAVTVRPLESQRVICKFDLTFEFVQTEAGIELNLIYNSDLFEQATPFLLVEKLRLILRQSIEDATRPLNSFDLRLEAERELEHTGSLLEFNF